MIYKLGKRPVKLDARNLKLARYLAEAPVLPSAIDWSPAVKGGFPMFMNQDIGDCAIAAPAHMTQLWTANADVQADVTDGDVLAAYRAVSGFDPDKPETDTGCAELDVLNYWRTIGIGWNTIAAFAEIAPGSRTEIKAAVAWFGGAYVGFILPASIRGQTVWDVVKDDGGELGGHAVNLVGYDADGVTCVTWGALQRISWAFVNDYMDEAYAVLSPDWFNSTGTSPSQLNLAQMQADLVAIRTL